MARLESDFPGQQGEDMAAVALVGNTPVEADMELRSNRVEEADMDDTYLPVAQVVADLDPDKGAGKAYCKEVVGLADPSSNYQ